MTEATERTMQELIKDAEDVMTFFEKRGLSPPEACAAMGIAITCLVGNKAAANSFMRAMRNELKRHFESAP